MQIKICDLTGVKSKSEFYDRIYYEFDVADYAANNLDALHDILTTDIEGPIEIVWGDLDGSASEMTWDEVNKILSVFRSVESDREDFILRISD